MKQLKPNTKFLYTGPLDPSCPWYHQRLFIVVSPYKNPKNDGVRSHIFRVPDHNLHIQPTDKFVLAYFIKWTELSALEKALWS